MTCITLLSPTELCLGILSLNIEEDTPKTGIPAEIVAMIPPVHFPIFGKQELDEIRTKVKRKKLPFADVLQSHGYVAQFLPDLVDGLVRESQCVAGNFPFFACLILHSFLSWMVSFKKERKVEYLNRLLRLLLVIADTAGHSHTEDVRELALSAFYQGFEDYLSFVPLVEFESFFDLLSNYLSTNRDLPEFSLMLFPQCLASLIKTDKSKVSETGASLMTYIGVLAEEMTGKFPVNIADCLIEYTTYLIADLDVIALGLLSHLMHQASLNSLLKVFGLLTRSICEQAIKLGPFINVDGINDMPESEYPEKSPSAVSLSFVEGQGFQNGIAENVNVKFPDRVEFSRLIHPKALQSLSLIVSAAPGNLECVELLLDSFAVVFPSFESKPQFCFDTAALYSFMCYHLGKYLNLENVIHVITSPPFLSPKLNVFEPTECYCYVSSVRTIIFDLLVSYKGEYLGYVLQKWMRYPLLFAEICYRFASHRGISCISETSLPRLAKALMHVSLYYQQCAIQKVGSYKVETARTAIFTLIAQILHSQELLGLFFNNEYFVSFFCSFVFEIPLRSFVISHIRRFFAEANNRPYGLLLNTLSQIFHICATSFPAEQPVSLTEDLLQLLSDVLTYRRCLAHEFWQLFDCLFPQLTTLMPTDRSRSFLLQALLFLSLAMANEPLSSQQVSSLETAVMNCFDNETPSELPHRLIQLIAGDCVPSNRPTFIIQQPKILQTYLKMAVAHDTVIESVDFVKGLCAYSSNNCDMCHSSGFDLFLIDILSNMRNEQPEITEHLLSLFEKIATSISSVAVVHRYISLLASVEGKIPEHQLLYINTLNSILSIASRIPVATMSLHDSATVELRNIDPDDVKTGFTFMTWIYIDEISTEYDPDLFCLTDSKGNSLRIFLTNAGCFYALQRDGNEAIGKIDIELIRQTWFTLSIHCNTKEGIIVGFVNCKPGKSKDMPELKLSASELKVVVGGNSPPYDYPVKLGPFGLFGNITNDEVSALYGLGPQMNGKLECDAIFLLQPQWMQQSMAFLAKKIKPGITGKVIKSSRRQCSSFTDILVRICKVETLIPLFAQLKALPPVVNFFPYFLTSIVNLLSQALLVSEEGQQSFSRAHGCFIISKFLRRMDDQLVDYQLYLQFAALMQSISHVPLQKELLDNIVFNPDIWLKCDPDGHLRILRHWARTVMPSFTGNAHQFFPFERLLFILRAYYWYEPIEGAMVRNIGRTRGMPLNVAECRQLLNQIGVIIASASVTKIDIDLLASHCLTLLESQQIVDLLMLLHLLISRKPSPIIGIQDLDLTSFLFPLFSSKSVFVYLGAIDIMWTAYEFQVISMDEFEERIGRSLEQVDTSILNDQLLDCLVQYMIGRKCYGLLRHCCCCASFLGENQFLGFMQRIEPKPEYCTYRNWTFWPVIAAFRVNSDVVTKRVMNFLVSCDTQSWSNLFDLVYVIGLCFGECDKYLAMTIDAMSEYLLNSASPVGFESYMTCAKLFWFFRPLDHCSSILEEAFRSCTADEWRQEWPPHCNLFVDRNTMMDQLSSVSVITDVVLKFCLPISAFRFGLRFSSSGEWMDSSACIRFSDLLLKFKEIQAQELSMLVYNFLCVEALEYVHANLETAQLTDDQMKSPSFSLLDKRYVNIDGDRLLDTDYSETLLLAFQQLDKFASNDTNAVTSRAHRALASVQSLIQEELEWSPDVNVILVLSLEQMHKYMSKSKTDALLQEKAWQRLWRSLATDRAPWGKTFPSAAHYTRDFTMCSFFCPGKLKRNWKFDDHTDAALARTTGHVIRKAQSETPMTKIGLKDESHETESSIILQADCWIVNPRIEKKAVFVLYKNRVRFNYDGVDYFKDWPLDEMKYIFFRRRFHLPNSLEFFTMDGKGAFVYFPNDESLPILSKMAALSMPNIVCIQTQPLLPFFKANSQTDSWLRGEISNFQYLMHLNMMSGRSFNDLSQYPFLPWIFSDYTTDKLDLKDPNIYRDLTKPVGALGADRLNELLERMPQLAQFETPYLYGSSHICMLTVCLYLIRLEPFTSQHISLQSGRFDQSSRIFHSIPDCWRIVTSLLNDYRELVPEFFFLPEFLVNLNHFDFGENAYGVVDDVTLPPWADSAYSFVYLQRKGLESDIVSRTLSSWIDLVWGYKQRGEEAQKANNIFKADMYDDAWDGKDSSDKLVRATIETTLFHVGQIPPQLFTEKHPVKVTVETPDILTDVYAMMVKGLKEVVVAFVERTGKFRYDIIIIDKLGFLITYHFDFQRLSSDLKKRAKSFVPPVSRPEIGTAPSSVAVCDGRKERDIKTSVVRKEIRGFTDHDITGETFAILPNRVFCLLDTRDRKILTASVANPVIKQHPLSVTRPFAVTSHQEYLAIAGNDAVITVFRGNSSTPHAVMPSYRDGITCSSINSTFQVIVIGTSDGYLLLNSLNKGSTVRVLDLSGAVPVKVLVTESWGFILCYATAITRGSLEHFLFLFSINGEQLKRVTIDFPVACWSAWSSTKGFDYAVLSDERGRIFCFEVFFMNVAGAIFRCHASLASLSFASELKCVVAVTREGRILFIPHDIESSCL